MTPPATDWKESPAEGEAAQLEVLAEQLQELQRARRHGGGTFRRTLHSKGQAGVEGQFTVLPDLEAHARVGLFATPASYRAYVRFSNGSPHQQPDRKPDVRGVAIKLLGVPGKKIIPGLEAATTQDFLLIQNASTPFSTAAEFVWFVRAASTPALLLPKAIGHLGPLGALRLIRRLVASSAAPVVSVATARYYSALPIKFGPYAVRYALFPHAAPDPAAQPGKGPEYLAEELAGRLARDAVHYDFRVQFFKDEVTTPIEDSSREWKESDAPFVTVARLTLPRQEVVSPRGQRLAQHVETLSFDPWHATADFRPLGNMMRARSAAYRISTQERGAAPEPEGTELIS